MMRNRPMHELIQDEELAALITQYFGASSRYKSAAGYAFSIDEHRWRLDKETSIDISQVVVLLEPNTAVGFVGSLVHVARTRAASHAANIFHRVRHMLRRTGGEKFTTARIINYRSTLCRSTEWYLATLQSQAPALVQWLSWIG
jgi:hypothetical protein